MLLARSVAAFWMLGTSDGGGLFKTSLKCYVQRLSCSPSDVNKYGLLTKLVRSRWLDIGRVPFFGCLWTETESRSIKTQKKRSRPISSHLDRTSLVNKGFIIWLLGKFFLRDKAGSPERARWLHHARSGTRFTSLAYQKQKNSYKINQWLHERLRQMQAQKTVSFQQKARVSAGIHLVNLENATTVEKSCERVWQVA